MFLIKLGLFLLFFYSNATVSTWLDLNSGRLARLYFIKSDRQYFSFLRTMHKPFYQHPTEDVPDWIGLNMKPYFSTARIRTELDGIYSDLSDYNAVLDNFGASGHQKDAAFIQFVDYLKQHRIRAGLMWDFDSKTIWIEEHGLPTIHLWPQDLRMQE